MDMDCTSNGSTDSNPSQYVSNITSNFYTDNIFYPGTKRTDFDPFFYEEKTDKKMDKNFKEKRNAYYINTEICTNKNPRIDYHPKKNFMYENYNKKMDDFVDNVKNQLEIFNIKGDPNVINLKSNDGFSKSTFSFSPDQVNSIYFK